MKKVEAEMDDDLRPEYDLRNLRVRRVGSKRQTFRRQSIQLEPAVAVVLPDSKIQRFDESTKC